MLLGDSNEGALGFPHLINPFRGIQSLHFRLRPVAKQGVLHCSPIDVGEGDGAESCGLMSFGVDDAHHKGKIAIPGIVNPLVEYKCAEMSHDLFVSSFDHAVFLLGVGGGHDMVYLC